MSRQTLGAPCMKYVALWLYCAVIGYLDFFSRPRLSSRSNDSDTRSADSQAASTEAKVTAFLEAAARAKIEAGIGLKGTRSRFMRRVLSVLCVLHTVLTLRIMGGSIIIHSAACIMGQGVGSRCLEFPGLFLQEHPSCFQES